MATLRNALFFYALVICLCMALGTYLMKDNPILGAINGLTVGVVIVVCLYNLFKDKLRY